MRIFRWCAVICLLTAFCSGQTPEAKTARYFQSIRNQPSLLLAFLQQMPKGGDLHVHLSGAIYAESMIDWASENALCVDRSTSKLIRASCDSCESYRNKPSVRCAYQDHVLYNQLIDAWSMRNWHGAEESGHDHFFATFDKFGPALDKHGGHALAEVASRAAADHVQYLELMQTLDGGQAAILADKVGWDDDFAAARDKLLAGGLRDIISTVRVRLDADEASQRDLLHCGTPQAQPGCNVTIRYLYQVLRGLQKEQVFAQILLGFELTKADPRVVGFNLVMPEDWYTPMHDFDLHMRVIEALRRFYPGTHISLHAGELAMGLVPPEGLRFHIKESVERAGAERIGHGVDIMNETEPLALLSEMAKRNVLVEICLTSNDVILGVSGEQHPLSIYMKHNVPVTLATDDQGVSRSDITHEYLRAAETYELSYADLKRMVRESLAHSFLPGAGISDPGTVKPPSCSADLGSSREPSGACKALLATSEKARAQWKLEQAFVDFERRF